MRRVGVALAVVALTLSARSAEAVNPPVLVFGDSVMTQIQWHAEPLAVLSQGFDLQLDVAICRTTTGVSCPFEGSRPPTLDERIAQLAAQKQIPPTVAIESGYNDDPATFAQAIESTVGLLESAGVRRILWLTMQEYARAQYHGMNNTLRAEAAKHKSLTVVDWNAYSHNQWSWFQSDGLHLGYEGGMQMARLVNAQLRESFAPPLRATTTKLVLERGRPVNGKLVTGGIPPYALRVVGGRPPRGVHLLARGRIEGAPRELGSRTFWVQIGDSAGKTVTTAVHITVDP